MRDQKAEAAVRARRRITVDREEYNALVDLRDTVFAETETRLLKVQNNFQELLSVNKGQLDRLCKQDRQIEQMRVVMNQLEEREKLLNSRCVHLESELASARAKAQDIEQLKKTLEETQRSLDMFRPATFTAKPPGR